MALIKCPECGKEVSDTVKECPNCGFKLKKDFIQLPFAAILYCTECARKSILLIISCL